jgi:hypothetical protein
VIPDTLTSPPWRWLAAGACLAAFALQLVAIERQSLIGDAAIHLLAGEQALRYGQNRLNLEHPPLVKMLAALPLVLEEPIAPPAGVRGSLETSANLFDDPARLERVRRRSHAILLVLFAVPFLAVCGALGSAIAGARTGFVLALALALALPVLPFLSVVQTDTAVAFGTIATLLAALAYVGAPATRSAALLGLAFGVALAAKFSALLLLPTICAAVALAARRSWRRRLVDAGATLVVAAAVLHATYALANRHYDAEAGRRLIRDYCGGAAMVVEDRMRRYEAPLLALERVSPEAAQWLTGLIGIAVQNQIGIYPSFAFGSIDSRGRWWYFPAALLVKTPIPLLVASVAAIFAWAVRWRRRRPRPWPPSAGVVLLAVTTAVYLGAAMGSTYNIGLRHLMPVLPILYLPAAAWAARSRGRAALLLGLLLLEAVAAAPFWMSATNTWWLGRHNPTRFALAHADGEYQQNFLGLAAAARERGIERLHVLYPPLPERQIRAYIPGAALVREDDPLEPGWYAVNVRVEQFFPALRHGDPRAIHSHRQLSAIVARWEPVWRAVARGEDHGYVAGTFHLYRLDAAPQRFDGSRSSSSTGSL